MREVIGPVSKPNGIQKRLRPFAPALASDLDAKSDVFHRGQTGKQVEALENEADRFASERESSDLEASVMSRPLM